MKRARNPWLPLLRALSLLALGGVWAIACGGPQKLGAAGSVCFRTDDCADGLACVPSKPGSSDRVCSADLTGIVSMVDGAPLEAAAPVADAASGTGGAGGATSSGGGGATAAAGSGGKAATGGATGMAGAGTAGKSAGGAPSGGAPSGGAPAGGAPAAGAPSGGAGTAGSGTTGGTGGSGPVDAGDG